MLKVAMIGAGAVAAIHAAQLKGDPEIELTSIYSRDREEAALFASRFGFRDVGRTLRESVERASVAIVCSPSAHHFSQARECLEAGVHTLVEIPPCEHMAEAQELGELAAARGAQLGCAHTARFLNPYEEICAAIRKQLLGKIVEIHYLRHLHLRAREWADNALLHHAAHAVDLVLSWCGGIQPVLCKTSPTVDRAQSVVLVGEIPGGGTVSISVSYLSQLPQSRMLVIGADHAVDTDGFSYLRSDIEQLKITSDEQASYHQAIGKQDRSFLNAVCGRGSYIPWEETVALMRVLDRARLLSG